MALQISAIIQLGYLPINAVVHFMAHLNAKTRVPLYKTCPRKYGFVTRRLYIIRHTILHLASPLWASCFTKCLNNAFNNKMGTHDSKMHTSLNIRCKNSLVNHPIHG